jgi:RNA 2',3'-cyclic 3'-phosphodiesterase
VRLFVALDVPDVARRALAELISKLQPKSHGARWVRPENLHITLKFIGHVDSDRLLPIRHALSTIQSTGPIDLRFHGMGFFPNERRPRAVWCGIAASPNLAPLAAEIDRALAPLGVDAETRPFTPHLTLARFKTDEGVAAVVHAANELKSYDFGHAVATDFHLYESLLKPSGAQYNRLASFPIAGGSAAEANQRKQTNE